jgi:hypothetical protein
LTKLAGNNKSGLSNVVVWKCLFFHDEMKAWMTPRRRLLPLTSGKSGVDESNGLGKEFRRPGRAEATGGFAFLQGCTNGLELRKSQLSWAMWAE